MRLKEDKISRVKHFFETSQFSTRGGVITDLDGTAVHEYEGRTIIHRSVEMGLKNIYNLGRPIVINTLRFPLSVIRTFAKDWYLMSNAAIPVILLNGSQLGYIIKNEYEFSFEPIISFPLSQEEIDDVLTRVNRFTKEDIQNIILFYYPLDWTSGEIIWTPDAERIPHLQQKYASASSVISTETGVLARELREQPVCMILMLVDIPGDRLMAYQHTKQSNFITREGIDKLSGAKKMAAHLNMELQHSIGAGDTDMDVFLKGVGLSLHVGNPSLAFEGSFDTLRLADFTEFGELLNLVAQKQITISK